MYIRYFPLKLLPQPRISSSISKGPYKKVPDVKPFLIWRFRFWFQVHLTQRENSLSYSDRMWERKFPRGVSTDSVCARGNWYTSKSSSFPRGREHLRLGYPASDTTCVVHRTGRTSRTAKVAVAIHKYKRKIGMYNPFDRLYIIWSINFNVEDHCK